MKQDPLDSRAFVQLRLQPHIKRMLKEIGAHYDMNQSALATRLIEEEHNRIWAWTHKNAAGALQAAPNAVVSAAVPSRSDPGRFPAYPRASYPGKPKP